MVYVWISPISPFGQIYAASGSVKVVTREWAALLSGPVKCEC